MSRRQRRGCARSTLLTGALLSLASPAGAELLVLQPGQAEPVCRVSGRVLGGWWVDEGTVAVASEAPHLLRLSDCQTLGPLPEYTRGEVAADPGGPWIVDANTVRWRATGARVAAVEGHLVAATRLQAASSGPPDARCAPGAPAPRPEHCEAEDLWWLGAGGALYRGGLLGADRVRPLYPPGGDVGVGGLAFVAAPEGLLLAAPARSTQSVHLFTVPEGRHHRTLVAPVPAGQAALPDGRWQQCQRPEPSPSGRHLLARCNTGAVVWQVDSGAAFTVQAPAEAEGWVDAATWHPTTGALVVAWDRTVSVLSDEALGVSLSARTAPTPTRQFALAGKGGAIKDLFFSPPGDPLWIATEPGGARPHAWPGGQVRPRPSPARPPLQYTHKSVGMPTQAARPPRRLSSEDPPPGIQSLTFGPADQVAYGLDGAPYLRVEDPQRAPWTPEVSVSNPAHAFLPDGRLAYSARGGVCVGHPGAQCEVFFATSDGFSHLAVSPDGRHLAVDPWHDGVRVLDLVGTLPPPGAHDVATRTRPAPEAITDRGLSGKHRPGHGGPHYGALFRAVTVPTSQRRSGAPELPWPGAPLADLSAGHLFAGSAGDLFFAGYAQVLRLDPAQRRWTAGPDGDTPWLPTRHGTYTGGGPAPRWPLWRDAQPVLDHPGRAPVAAMAISRDGQRLALADTTGALWLRSASGSGPDPAPAARLAVRASRLAFSPDGARLLVVGEAPVAAEPPPEPSASVRLAPLATTAPNLRLGPATLQAWRGAISTAAGANDGRFAVVHGAELTLFDAQGRPGAPVPVRPPVALAFAGPDLWLVQGGATGFDRFDPATGRLQRVHPLAEGLRVHPATLRWDATRNTLWLAAEASLQGSRHVLIGQPLGGTRSVETDRVTTPRAPVEAPARAPAQGAAVLAAEAQVWVDPTAGLPVEGRGGRSIEWALIDHTTDDRGELVALLQRLDEGQNGRLFARTLPMRALRAPDPSRPAHDAEGALAPTLTAGKLPAPQAIFGGREAYAEASAPTPRGWLVSQTDTLHRLEAGGRAAAKSPLSEGEPVWLAATAEGTALALHSQTLSVHVPGAAPTQVPLGLPGRAERVVALSGGRALVSWAASSNPPDGGAAPSPSGFAIVRWVSDASTP